VTMYMTEEIKFLTEVSQIGFGTLTLAVVFYCIQKITTQAMEDRKIYMQTIATLDESHNKQAQRHYDLESKMLETYARIVEAINSHDGPKQNP
jgi:hypothetical protein